MQSTVQETERFEFYWYDIVDTEKTFNERFDLMHEYAEELKLSEFNPIKEWGEGELKVQFVPHVEITGWSSIKALHDKYVKEGWEGLVIRNVDEVYGPGKKSNAMLKIKNYLDSEYKIVGLSEGLRDEDMCFVMETEDGQQFKAKPIGDRAQKQWYRDNLDDIIGKMGTLKYFEMSGKEGSQIPQQPIFICIREDL
jgi:DNA ligase-1